MANNDHAIDQIDFSPLQSVAAIAAVQVVNGISIELHAVEIRDAGGRITLRVEDLRQPTRRTDFSPSDLTLDDPVLLIEDARGRQYQTEVRAAEATLAEVLRFHCAFAPAPEAWPLTVTISQFGSPLNSAKPETIIEGPWSFQVSSPGALATRQVR